MSFRWNSPGGVVALACGIAFVVAIWPACGCLPTEYREVDLASLPEVVRSDARKVEPEIHPKRAWAFWIGGRRGDRVVDGYLIRGKIPGSWWAKDFKVYVSRTPSDQEPIDLRPID